MEEVRRELEVPGVDVNEGHAAGRTPLLTSCASGFVEVVSLLLRAPGIDVNLASKDGRRISTGHPTLATLRW